jgi:uncharacterized membrane protein
MVGVIAFIYAVFLVVSKLDPNPNKERCEEFGPVYLKFRTAIIFIMVLIQALTGLYNIGYPVSIDTWVSVIIGCLFIYMGNFMAKVKRNWFVGVRTPWTISLENVWNKTNRAGGYLFVVWGFMMIATPFLSHTFAAVALFGGAALAIFGTFGYSYWPYRKEKHQ